MQIFFIVRWAYYMIFYVFHGKTFDQSDRMKDQRFWWRMLETKCVGDKFKMLLTDLKHWKKNQHNEKVPNITFSPASLPPFLDRMKMLWPDVGDRMLVTETAQTATNNLGQHNNLVMNTFCLQHWSPMSIKTFFNFTSLHFPVCLSYFRSLRMWWRDFENLKILKKI